MFHLGQEVRRQMVAAAQEVYDLWDQDEDGFDEQYGGGGICDDVAEALAGVLAVAGFDAQTLHHEQENHTVVLVRHLGSVWEVDLPLYLYEQGSWYNYKKVLGVVFEADDITVFRTSISPDEFDGLMESQ